MPYAAHCGSPHTVTACRFVVPLSSIKPILSVYLSVPSSHLLSRQSADLFSGEDPTALPCPLPPPPKRGREKKNQHPLSWPLVGPLSHAQAHAHACTPRSTDVKETKSRRRQPTNTPHHLTTRRDTARPSTIRPSQSPCLSAPKGPASRLTGNPPDGQTSKTRNPEQASPPARRCRRACSLPAADAFSRLSSQPRPGPLSLPPQPRSLRLPTDHPSCYRPPCLELSRRLS